MWLCTDKLVELVSNQYQYVVEEMVKNTSTTAAVDPVQLKQNNFVSEDRMSVF